MIRRNIRIVSILVITAIMLACVPTLLPAPAPIPTFDPNSINTVIALTAGAAATQTALMLPPTFTPTATSLPTNTPTETASPTFIFILPTITVLPTMVTPGSSGEQFDCQIISRNPANDSVIAPGAAFEVIWQIANIGKKTWFSSDVDYRFSSGAKLHKQSIYDLESSVMPGTTVDIKVNMKAPNEPGTYTTNWKINIGKDSFCPMDLTILVK